MSAPGRSSHILRMVAVVLAATAFGGVVWQPSASAEIPSIASRQRAEKKTFTDSEITDGFLKTAFGAEYHLAGRVDRIRKYDAPVRVFADGASRPDRRAQLAKVVADIAERRSASRHRHGRQQRRRQCLVKLVRDRDLYSHHPDILRQRAGTGLTRTLAPSWLQAGKFTRRCAEWLEERFGVDVALLVPRARRRWRCGAALDLGRATRSSCPRSRSSRRANAVVLPARRRCSSTSGPTR